MTRKSRKQSAVEAAQDADYRALSAEQRDALQGAIYQSVSDYDAGIAEVDEDIQHAAFLLVEETRRLRAEWGDGIVSAAMRDRVAETCLRLPQSPESVEEAEAMIAEEEADALLDAATEAGTIQ